MPITVFGPFTVGTVRRQTGNRTEVRTSIQVQAGDRITTQSSGLVDFGGAFIGLGAPILNADGDTFPTPSTYPAPSLRKNSLICKIGASSTIFFQGGVNRSFAVPTGASGTLILDVNDDNPGDNSRGWSVFVMLFRAATVGPPETPPIGRSWVYHTIAGAGGIFGADVGHSPAAVMRGNDVHVFYGGADWKLHHIVLRHNFIQPFYTMVTEEVLDGAGGPNGRTSRPIPDTFQISAVVLSGAVHVFYCEIGPTLQLRHASSTDGINWSFEVVDGPDGVATGRIDGMCGILSNAIVYRNRLHVFYYRQSDRNLGPGDNGLGVPIQDLGHGVLDGAGWQCETLDGQGGTNGRVNAAVGLSACAAPWTPMTPSMSFITTRTTRICAMLGLMGKHGDSRPLMARATRIR